MIYDAIYKCQLCGAKFRVNSSGFEYNNQQIVDLANRAVQNQQFIGNNFLHQVPMHCVHSCNSTDAGVAQFAGFKARK